jgi:hypothetical protein
MLWYILIAILVGFGVGYGCRGFINRKLREGKEKVVKVF